LPVVTPSEKVDDAPVHITPASPNKKSTAIVITVEKQVKEDHKEVIEVSADEKEETCPQMSRRESISEDSSVFPTLLEVDHGIERLVSSPSPLRCSTTSVDIHHPMPHEELSSFFISSPSCTNISLDHSIRMGLLETSTNASALSESPKNLSEAFNAGSLRLIERTTTSPNKTTNNDEKKEIIPIAMEIDTSSDYFQQQEENPTTTVVDESLLVSPDNGRQSGRKRKPVNAFDPTPTTKPKKPRTKKGPAVAVVVVTATEGDSTDATVTNVATMENLLSTSENPVDESNVSEANKSAKKAKTPAKPRTKTPKATATTATPTGEVAPTDPNAPLVATTPVIPVTPVVVPPTPPPLPEEMKMKVDQINEKMTALAEELVPTFELKAEYNDHELELFNDKFYADLLCVLRDPASFNLYFCPSAATVVTATTTVAALTTSSAVVASSEENNNNSPSTNMNTPAKPTMEVIDLEAENNAPTAVSTPMDLCSPAPVSSLAPSTTTVVPPVVVMTPEEVTKSIVQMIVTRLIQGCSSTLSVLTTSVQSKFIPLIEWIEKLELIDENNNNNCNTLRPLLLEELKKLSQPNNSLLLQTILTTLALRESYGFRAKNSLSFEDLSIVAVYRWECHSMQFFSKVSQAIIREIKTIRSKYSRTIKGFSKVIEQIYKTPQDLTKILPLEEKATKSLAEIEKTKEKRREFELKKALELEEKMKKQEVIEKKKREKEEADLKKKQELEAQQQFKNQAQLEKEKQEQAKKEKLAKQQNTFQSFFGKPAGGSKPITAPITASSATACSSSVQTVDITKNSSSSVSCSPSSSMKPMKEVIDLDAEEQKHGQFIALVQKKHSFEEISQLRRLKRKEEKQLKRKFTPKESKKKPKTVKIQIFAENNNNENQSNHNPFLMDEENHNYSELQERMVSNCMKTLSFAEDYRPPYYGTYSKKSLIISGRRPFAKDHELFHYEYDSEEEWEEEIEGEDIGESDGEEGDEDEEDEREVVKDKDGLMYDDFFRQDGDFGSDIDSDGEEIAAVALPNFARIKEEIAGLRFIEHQSIATWHQQSSTYFQPEEGQSSSQQPLPKKDYVSNPTLLKGDSSKRNNGVSCSKYTLMKEEGEPVFIGINDCREDHECMQLMNYYAVVYNPTLLNLDLERFNQKNNEKKPKKKKATAKKTEEGVNKTEATATSAVSSPSAEKNATEGVPVDPSKPVKEKKPRKKPEKKKTAEATAEGTATTTTEEGATPVTTTTATTTEKKKKPVKKLMEKILAEKRSAKQEEEQRKETVDKKNESTTTNTTSSPSSSVLNTTENAIVASSSSSAVVPVPETKTTKVSCSVHLIILKS
jgi:hypothetical protein